MAETNTITDDGNDQQVLDAVDLRQEEDSVAENEEVSELAGDKSLQNDLKNQVIMLGSDVEEVETRSHSEEVTEMVPVVGRSEEVSEVAGDHAIRNIEKNRVIILGSDEEEVEKSNHSEVTEIIPVIEEKSHEDFTHEQEKSPNYCEKSPNHCENSVSPVTEKTISSNLEKHCLDVQIKLERDCDDSVNSVNNSVAENIQENQTRDSPKDTDKKMSLTETRIILRDVIKAGILKSPDLKQSGSEALSDDAQKTGASPKKCSPGVSTNSKPHSETGGDTTSERMSFFSLLDLEQKNATTTGDRKKPKKLCCDGCEPEDMTSDEIVAEFRASFPTPGITDYTIPFDYGWKRELVLRNVVSKKGSRMADVYYQTPDKKKLRSMPDIEKYLNDKKVDLKMSFFTFRKEPVYKEPLETIRVAGPSKRKFADSTPTPNCVSKAGSETDSPSKRFKHPDDVTKQLVGVIAKFVKQEQTPPSTPDQEGIKKKRGRPRIKPEIPDELKVPKKRGRPPKIKSENETSPDCKETSPERKLAKRSPSSDASTAKFSPLKIMFGKKRGRKPKHKTGSSILCIKVQPNKKTPNEKDSKQSTEEIPKRTDQETIKTSVGELMKDSDKASPTKIPVSTSGTDKPCTMSKPESSSVIKVTVISPPSNPGEVPSSKPSELQANVNQANVNQANVNQAKSVVKIVKGSPNQKLQNSQVQHDKGGKPRIIKTMLPKPKIASQKCTNKSNTVTKATIDCTKGYMKSMPIKKLHVVEPKKKQSPAPLHRTPSICDLKCKGRGGRPPSLNCNICMSLFHPECVGIVDGSHWRGFNCWGCRIMNSDIEAEETLCLQNNEQNGPQSPMPRYTGPPPLRPVSNLSSASKLKMDSPTMPALRKPPPLIRCSQPNTTTTSESSLVINVKSVISKPDGPPPRLTQHVATTDSHHMECIVPSFSTPVPYSVRLPPLQPDLPAPPPPPLQPPLHAPLRGNGFVPQLMSSSPPLPYGTRPPLQPCYTDSSTRPMYTNNTPVQESLTIPPVLTTPQMPDPNGMVSIVNPLTGIVEVHPSMSATQPLSTMANQFQLNPTMALQAMTNQLPPTLPHRPVGQQILQMNNPFTPWSNAYVQSPNIAYPPRSSYLPPHMQAEMPMYRTTPPTPEGTPSPPMDPKAPRCKKPKLNHSSPMPLQPVSFDTRSPTPDSNGDVTQDTSNQDNSKQSTSTQTISNDGTDFYLGPELGKDMYPKESQEYKSSPASEVTGQTLTLPPSVIYKFNLSRPLQLRVCNRRIRVEPSCYVISRNSFKILLPPFSLPDRLVDPAGCKPLDITISRETGNKLQTVNVRAMETYHAPDLTLKDITNRPGHGSSRDKLKKHSHSESTKKSPTKECTFQTLHAGNDCILHIFHYLSLPDLIRASRVCKVWQNVASFSCLWKRVSLKNAKVTDWSQAFKKFKHHGTQRLCMTGILQDESHYKQSWKSFTDGLNELTSLKHVVFGKCPVETLHSVVDCLPNLRSLSAEYISDMLDESQQWSTECTLDVGKIALMKDLEDLRLRALCGIKIPSFSFSGGLSQLESCSKLYTLSLTSLRNVAGYEFSFLPTMQNLQFLEIGDVKGWTKETYSFLGMLTNLKVLRLILGGDLKETGLEESLLKLEKLHELELVKYIVSRSLAKTLAQMKHLTALSVWPETSVQMAEVNTNLLNAVKEMSGLERLTWGVIVDKDLSTDNHGAEDNSPSESDRKSEQSEPGSVAFFEETNDIANPSFQSIKYIKYQDLLQQLCSYLPALCKIRMFRVPVIEPPS